MKTLSKKVIPLTLAITVWSFATAPVIHAGIRANSRAFGKTAAEWNDIYQRWSAGVLAVPVDGNGNAVIPPHTVLMPFPNTLGDGTPGHIDVTLGAGQSFVLPLWNLVGFEYTDPTIPPDDLVDVSVFRTLDITFQIDGRTVIDKTNVLNFYSEFFFNPAIPVVDPDVAAFICFQGVGVVHQPLSVGTHTFQLDAVNTEPAFGAIFAYHNTWTVTVRAGK